VSSSGGSSAGVLIGIIVAVVVCLLIIVVVIVVITRSRRRKTSAPLSVPIDVPLEKKIKYKSAKDIGLSFDQNPAHRKTMEDEHVMIDGFADHEDWGFFAIYDGHGGRGVVEFVAHNLHINLLDGLKGGTDPREALAKAFSKTDQQIVDKNIQKSGSTAVVALLYTKEEEGVKQRMLCVANIGDTNAVLRRGDGDAKQLTVEHNAAKNEKEVQRIQEGGAFVVQGKVAGSLSVTRAFGDLELKKWVIPDPHIKSLKLMPTDTHLILACDGLWDVVTFKEVTDYLYKSYQQGTRDPTTLSEQLVKLALDKGSKDNVSVMVIEL